jgi:hypothetical protein
VYGSFCRSFAKYVLSLLLVVLFGFWFDYVNGGFGWFVLHSYVSFFVLLSIKHSSECFSFFLFLVLSRFYANFDYIFVVWV